MAQVQSSEGIPEVAPHTAVPDDYQRIQATPEEFGGQIARGEQQLGAGTENAVKFFGKVQTDDATNNAMQRMDNAINKFKNLQGADRLRAQKDTEQEIETAYQEGRQGLNSPEQLLDYDNQTRNFRLRYISGQMTTLGAEAAKTVATATNTNGKNLHLGIIASSPYNDQVFADNLTGAAVFARQQAHIEGLGPEAEKQAATQAVAEGWATRIRSISVRDPTAAYEMAQKNQKALSVVENRTGLTYYDQLSRELEARKNQQVTDGAAREIFNRANQKEPGAQVVPVAGAPVTPQSVHSAIIRQESGGNLNEPPSVNNAIGVGQVTPETFKQYARPGEKIDNPADNLAVSQRIVNDYYQKFKGDPQRVAVAYFSGPGNVAPEGSPTPWIRNAADGTGKTTASYVADVSRRLGVSDGKSTAFQMAMERFPDDPVLQHETATKLSRMFADQEIADNQTQRQRTEAVNKAIGGYTTRMWDMMHSPNPDYVELAGEINHDPALAEAGPQKDAIMARLIRLSGEEQSLAYGPGYRAARDALFSEPDAPGHIDSIVPLLNRDDITMAGLKDLQERFSLARSGPDKMATEKIINSYLKYSQDKMGREQDAGPIKIVNAKGAALYNSEFVPRFMRQVALLEQQAEKTGSMEKLDKFLSHENVDQMIDQIYPRAQRAMDEIGATAEAMGGETGAASPPPLPGVTPQAWQSLMAVRPIAANGKPIHPLQWSNALQMLSNGRDDPAVVKAFDDYWGKGGFEAKTTLEKLGPVASTAQPQGSAPAAASQPPATSAAPAPVRAPAVPPRQPLPPGVAAESATRAAEDARAAAERQREFEELDKRMRAVREGRH